MLKKNFTRTHTAIYRPHPVRLRSDPSCRSVAQSTNSRSQETEVPRTTVREKAKQFVMEGMLGLVDQRSTAAGTGKSDFLTHCQIHSIPEASVPAHPLSRNRAHYRQ